MTNQYALTVEIAEERRRFDDGVLNRSSLMDSLSAMAWMMSRGGEG